MYDDFSCLISMMKFLPFFGPDGRNTPVAVLSSLQCSALLCSDLKYGFIVARGFTFEQARFCPEQIYLTFWAKWAQYAHRRFVLPSMLRPTVLRPKIQDHCSTHAFNITVADLSTAVAVVHLDKYGERHEGITKQDHFHSFLRKRRNCPCAVSAQLHFRRSCSRYFHYHVLLPFTRQMFLKIGEKIPSKNFGSKSVLDLSAPTCIILKTSR